MIKQMKVGNLKQDETIYPRVKLNWFHVAEMVEALESGKKLPPLVADKATKKVIDGWHRIEALKKYWKLGNDTQVEVDLREYVNEAEMFTDSIRLNASHGQGFSPSDRLSTIVKAEKLELTIDTVASLLNITLDKATSMKQERLGTFNLKPIILKSTMGHLAGHDLTEEQSQFTHKAGGMNQTFYINQVIGLVVSDSLDWNNEKVMNAIRKLFELLSGKLLVK